MAASARVQAEAATNPHDTTNSTNLLVGRLAFRGDDCLLCWLASLWGWLPVMLVSVRDAFDSPATHTSFRRIAHLQISRVVYSVTHTFLSGGTGD